MNPAANSAKKIKKQINAVTNKSLNNTSKKNGDSRISYIKASNKGVVNKFLVNFFIEQVVPIRKNSEAGHSTNNF